jgi:Bacterial Ig-like domain (group 2)
MKLWLAFGVLAFSFACGGDSGGGSPTSPTSPATPSSQTPSSVTVALVSPMYLGFVQQATAATSPAGISGTWASTDQRIATVDTAGSVRGLASGTTEITYTAGGATGRASVRVVPEYAGIWRGDYSITSCSDNGAFRNIDFCKTYTRNGLDAGMRAEWTQDGTEVIGRIGIAPNWPDSDRNTGRIEENGRMVFGGNINLDGFNIRATWELNSTQRGVITPAGAMTEEWTYPGVQGSARITASIRVLRKQ